MKKIYIDINIKLNIYKIIEYCYNRLAIVKLDEAKRTSTKFSSCGERPQIIQIPTTNPIYSNGAFRLSKPSCPQLPYK